MKKLIALLLCAVMVLGLAACGSSGSGTQTTAAASGSDTAKTETASGSGEYPVIRWAYTAIFPTPDEEKVEVHATC